MCLGLSHNSFNTSCFSCKKSLSYEPRTFTRNKVMKTDISSRIIMEWFGFSIVWLLTLVRQRLWKPDVSSTHCVIIAGTRGSMTTTDLHLPPNPTCEWVSECIWLKTQMPLKTGQKQMPLNRFMSIKTQFSTTKFVISLETKWGRPFSTRDPVCSCWGDICNRSDTIGYLWESVKAMALLAPNLYSAVIGPCDKPFPFYIKCGCSYPSLQTPQL
jgi:hypothetical protein